jgi:hypothetical protein
MTVTLRSLGVLLVIVAAQPAQTGETGEPDANVDLAASIEQLNLRPAEVQLAREPDLAKEFATLQLEDGPAPKDYATDHKPFMKEGKATCHLIHGGLKKGTAYYTDRVYRINLVPQALEGLTLLQTRNGHKCIVDGRYAIVVVSDEPCYCFVALDERAAAVYQEHGMPSWLEEFTLTKYRITTDDAFMEGADTGYIVLAKYAPAGRIALGPHAGHPLDTSMYFAFFGTVGNRDN